MRIRDRSFLLIAHLLCNSPLPALNSWIASYLPGPDSRSKLRWTQVQVSAILPDTSRTIASSKYLVWTHALQI
jgi:hypothetical protein